jgi:dihydroorotate dehydrogenase electron transfer subunit
MTQPKPAGLAERRYTVVQNRMVCDRHFLLEVAIPEGVRMDLRAGQFFHLVCDPDADGGAPPPLTLRRPISIHRVRYHGTDRRPVSISFLYRVVGAGTESLSRIKPGGCVDALGPLGRGFTIGAEQTAVIVSGGIGVAPLAALADELRNAGKDVLVYLGAVRREMLALTVSHVDLAAEQDARSDLLDVIRREFEGIGAQVMGVCTDDGSAGAKALVPALFECGIQDGNVPLQNTMVYACGPKGMMAAVAEITDRHGLPAQVSLEERMACGIGACYACTCSVVGPGSTIQKKRVCREGPVFPAKDIQWKD